MAVDINGDGLIALGGTSSTQGRLRLAEDTDNGTNYIELTAPASVASNRTITFPDVTGTVLTNASAGTVLQVVQATYSTQTNITSTSYTDSGLTASITPSSASNKILILVTQESQVSRSINDYVRGNARILRGATEIYVQLAFVGIRAATGAGGDIISSGCFSAIYLDSPSTTSSTTYKTQGALNTTSNSATLLFQNDNTTSTITLMEIAA